MWLRARPSFVTLSPVQSAAGLPAAPPAFDTAAPPPALEGVAAAAAAAAAPPLLELDDLLGWHAEVQQQAAAGAERPPAAAAWPLPVPQLVPVLEVLATGAAYYTAPFARDVAAGALAASMRILLVTASDSDLRHTSVDTVRRAWAAGGDGWSRRATAKLTCSVSPPTG